MNDTEVRSIANMIEQHGLSGTLEGMQRACALLADEQMGGPWTDAYMALSHALSGMHSRMLVEFGLSAAR